MNVCEAIELFLESAPSELTQDETEEVVELTL